MSGTIQMDALNNEPTTPVMSSKPLPGSMLPPNMFSGSFSLPSGTGSRRTGLQRIDLEPIYAELKKSVGDQWSLYRESVGLFILGSLNQEELSRRIDSFILKSAPVAHLHNQLIAGIYSNSLREPPETEIAHFVSAHSKPAAVAAGKPATGDAAEQRLKAEIMALPARERYRLKQLADAGAGNDAFQSIMKMVKDSRSIKPPDVVPASAGGFNKTNWELEIAKRFELPLFWESAEFPDADAIHKRMVPICYQEGLAGGCTNSCADLVTVAAEAFVKQLLTECFRRVRSNGVNYIQSSKFRRKLVHEEDQHRRGLIKRDSFGLLPVEMDIERTRPHFGIEDLRFGLKMGNSYMSQNKILGAKIFNRALSRSENRDLEDRHGLGNEKARASGALTNGLSNGISGHVHEDDDMDWKKNESALDELLDEVLDF